MISFIILGLLAGVIILLVDIRDSVQAVLQKQRTLVQQGASLMATIAEVQAAFEKLIADLQASITKEFDETAVEFHKLKDIIANGGAAAAADLDNLINRFNSAKLALTQQLDAISTQGAIENPPPPGP